jgi:RecB family exonuclease
MGSVVHKVFEISLKARILNHPKIQNPWDLRNSVYEKYGLSPDLYELTDELINSAIQWGYFRKENRARECELKFNEPITDGTIVRGFIDRLDLHNGDAEIIDLKTQKNVATAEELRNKWQSKIYNIAVRKLYPEIKNVKMSYWILRHLVQTISLTSEDAERHELELVEVAKKIRNSSKPEGRISALCPWCLYVDDCETKKGGIGKSLKNKSWMKNND